MTGHLDVDLLRATWAEASGHDRFVVDFYARLALAAPHLRALFGVHMADQRAKLAATLAMVVRGADTDHLPGLVPHLQRLGRRHRFYGANPGDYSVVGQVLAATLADHLGDTWTDDAGKAWATAYEMVAGVMADAARADDTAGVPAAWAGTVIRRRDLHGGTVALYVDVDNYPATARPEIHLAADLAGDPNTRLTARAVRHDDTRLVVAVPVTRAGLAGVHWAAVAACDVIRLSAPLDPLTKEDP